MDIKLTKMTNDGRFVFCKEGVYFALTKEQARLIPLLIEEYEECPEYWEENNGRI